MWSQDVKSGTDALACRGCLTSSVKLFSIEENNLVDNYVTLVGISLEDNYSHHLCGICATMLLKFCSFRERCLMAYHLLMDADYHEKDITEYIEVPNIRTYSNQLTLPYAHSKVQTRNYVPLEYMNDEVRIEVIGSDLSRTFTTLDDLKRDNVTKVNKMEIKMDGKIEIDTVDSKANVKNESVDDDFEVSKGDNDDEFSDSEDDATVFETGIKVGKSDNDSTDEDTIKKKVPKKKSANKKMVANKRPKTDQEILEYIKPFKFEVTFLNEKEQFAEIEAKKSNLQPNQCELCGKKFKSSYCFNRHKEIHHDSNIKYDCNICHLRFNNHFGYLRHKGAHGVLYKCTTCQFQTKRVELLEPHYLRHQGKIHVCEHCSNNFKSRTAYLTHVRIHHASILPWCELCGEAFLNEKGIFYHKSKAHRGVKVEFPCSGCGVKFSCESALDLHVRRECGLENCVQCGEGFQTDQLLRKHVVQTHSIEIPMIGCEGCAVKFHNTKALQKHNQCCGSGVPCAQCGGHFDNDALMLEHVRVEHSGGTDFLCVGCGKKFTNAFHYRDHIIRVHQKPNTQTTRARRKRTVRSDRNDETRKWRPVGEEEVAMETKRKKGGNGTHMCEVCGWVFKDVSQLKTHMATHSDARPFQCSHCPKTFRTHASLEMHTRVHTGDRPYKCEVCLKTFKIYTGLNRHMLIHTGERKHICQICDKSFPTSTGVKMHIKNVHLKIPYPKRKRKVN